MSACPVQPGSPRCHVFPVTVVLGCQCPRDAVLTAKIWRIIRVGLSGLVVVPPVNLFKGIELAAKLRLGKGRLEGAYVEGTDSAPSLLAGDPSQAHVMKLEPDPANTGYGHAATDVARVRPDDADVLVEYLDVVHRRTCSMLDGLTTADLDRVVDRHWDPPVTLGVRLVSVADDCLQHVGQAAYVRGLLGR